MWLTALAVLNICPTVLLERLPTELCSTFFTLGCQKSRCSDAWCQQREHYQPASGCCLRSSWPALHGPLHCYFCRGVSQLAPRAGGTLQITARERRYLCRCQFAFQTALVLIISLFSPFFFPLQDAKMNFMHILCLRWSARRRCGTPDLSSSQRESGVFDSVWRGGRRQSAAGWEECQSQGIWKWKLCWANYPERSYGEIFR